MIMEEFVSYNGKKLRKGYTTGTCATAAATAACMQFFKNETVSEIKVTLPNEQELLIPIELVEKHQDFAIAAVKKDGGDDADATHGMLIYAKVMVNSTGKVVVDGGTGIGRVTQEGLLVPIGEAAINPVPRKMIKKSILNCLPPDQGADVLIFAPEGKKIAELTMNGRLGIKGGISILGTTGIVTPMSEEGWKQAITIELEMKRKQGHQKIVLSPGNYGEDFAVEQLGIDTDKIVSMSNFVGYVLKEVQRLGYEKVLIIGHLGKIIKVSAGIFSTHSKDADARAEVMVANLALLGMPPEQLAEVYKCSTTEAAGDLIEKYGYDAVYPVIVDKIQNRCQRLLRYRDPETVVDVVMFSSKRGYLASTKPLNSLKEEWQ